MLNWVGIDQPMKMRETSRAKDKKPQVNNNPKTDLARQIAASLGWKFYSIDVNLLKEGEIGGQLFRELIKLFAQKAHSYSNVCL